MLLVIKRTEDCCRQKAIVNRAEQGFSLVELLVVIVLISIMTTFAIFGLAGHKTAYGAEDQALKIIDLIRDARQRAITQRQVMRFEIDFTDNVIRLIDEQKTEGAGGIDPHTNDIMMRQDLLSSNVALVREPGPNDRPPDGITATVVPDPTVPAISTSVSNHPLSKGHRVWAIRFKSNGTAVGEAENAGLISGTLFLWPPQAGNRNSPQSLQLVHAVTLYGGTGIVRLWQYNGTAFVGK